MDRKKAIEWMDREIFFLKEMLNVGKDCELKEEFEERIQIYELAIDALSMEETVYKLLDEMGLSK